MSKPKVARILNWGRSPWRPFYDPDTGTIRVRLVDDSETDRINLLVLGCEEAAQLAERLTRLALDAEMYS